MVSGEGCCQEVRRHEHSEVSFGLSPVGSRLTLMNWPEALEVAAG